MGGCGMSTPKNIWELDFTTLKLILDNSYDEISLINAQGVVVYVNPVCEKNYGLKADEVIGTHIAELTDKGVLDCCIGAQVIEEKRQIITQQNTRSGKHFLVSAVPIFNDAGDLTFIVTNSRDITDFKRALAKIRNQKRELAQFEGKLKSLSLELMESRGFIARSQKMEDVIRKAKTYAMVDSTVLMTCETGTGKSLFAHLIHEMGARAAKRMVSINCAAIPSELLETELFGYEPGAFTGAANRGKPGMFELADGGTLFLDEIGELPPPMQAKLLHALQDRVIRRLGSTRDIPVDVRLICATNRDLTKMVQDRLFRQDLYYRIKVLHLQLPALRERQEDIIPLACHFLEKWRQVWKDPPDGTSRAQDIEGISLARQHQGTGKCDGGIGSDSALRQGHARRSSGQCARRRATRWVSSPGTHLRSDDGRHSQNSYCESLCGIRQFVCRGETPEYQPEQGLTPDPKVHRG